jgi:thymidylate synthase
LANCGDASEFFGQRKPEFSGGDGGFQEHKMRLTFIEAKTLDEAWFKCLFELFQAEHCTYLVEQGSYEGDTRREFDWITVHIKTPGGAPGSDKGSLRRLIPTVPYGVPPPCDEEGVLRYFSEYLFCEQKRPGEQYTYGSRLCRRMDGKSQIQIVIDRYRKGHGTNQLVLQVAEPEDLLLEDPPCLRHIDTRIRDGKLHFMPYFRSWDLWGGFPLNLAGIQLLKEYMASEIGVEDGEIIATSKGLHVYGHAEDVARMRAGKKKGAGRPG